MNARFLFLIVSFSTLLSSIVSAQSGGALTMTIGNESAPITQTITATGSVTQTGSANNISRYDSMISHLNTQKTSAINLLKEEEKNTKKNLTDTIAALPYDPSRLQSCVIDGKEIDWTLTFDQMEIAIDDEYRSLLAKVYVQKIQNENKKVTDAMIVGDSLLNTQILQLGQIYQGLITDLGKRNNQKIIDSQNTMLSLFTKNPASKSIVTLLPQLEKYRETIVKNLPQQTNLYGMSREKFIATEKQLSSIIRQIYQQKHEKTIQNLLKRSPYIPLEKDMQIEKESLLLDYDIAYLSFVDKQFAGVLSKGGYESWMNAYQTQKLRFLSNEGLFVCDRIAQATTDDTNVLAAMNDEAQTILNRFETGTSGSFATGSTTQGGNTTFAQLKKAYLEFFGTQRNTSRKSLNANISSANRRYSDIATPNYALLDELEALNNQYRSMDNEDKKELLRTNDILPKAQILASITIVKSIKERAQRIADVMTTQADRFASTPTPTPAQDTQQPVQDAQQPTETKKPETSVSSTPLLSSLASDDQSQINAAVKKQIDALTKRFPDKNARNVAARTVKDNAQKKSQEIGISDIQRVLYSELIKALDALIAS